MAIEVSQFLQTFYEESFEGLDLMESGLLNLRDGEPDAELVNDIFRAAHSIKGGSATFGLSDVASFTHLMETLLDELRDGRREVNHQLVALLLEAVDVLRHLLSTSKAGTEQDAERIADVESRLQQMLGDVAEEGPDGSRAAEGDVTGGWRIVFRPHPELYLTGNDPVRIFLELADMGELRARADLASLPDLEELDPESSFLAWTLELRGEVPRSALDEVFAWVVDICELDIAPLQAEVAPSKPQTDKISKAEPPVERSKGADRRSAMSIDGGSIRVNIEKVDTIINLVGELIITQSMLSTLGEDFEISRVQQLRDGLVQLERNTRELQEDVMRMRMLPIGTVFHRFPRMVHDLSAQLGKEVELRMSGEHTELDKTLVEKISDPLVHLVRNALDHGIEPADERRAGGKSPVGRVWLNAYHKGGNIVIEVGDDGRGLVAERIFAKAVERGLVAPDVELDDQQVRDLLFVPGFSTAETVSDVSGRGVGMDVVRRNIESLNGSIEVNSVPGEGSTFTVRLPLTLAVLDGQSVAVGDETYIIPLVSISESIQVKPGMINHVAGKGETFHWRGDYLRLIRLGDVFGVKSRVDGLSDGLLVVVEGEGRHVGLFVDELLGQQQVVIKSMEENYKRVEAISGATILGDGSVALILDVPSLIRMASREQTFAGERRKAG